jgi:hypothetical protein
MERLGDLTNQLRRTEAVNDFLKFVQLIASNRPERQSFTEDAKRVMSPRLKAAVTAATVGASTWGSDTSWQQISSAWMSLFSSRTLPGRIPFRRADFNTRTLVEDTPGTAAYVTEGGSIPLCSLSLDVVQLPPAKIGGMVVFTREAVEVGSQVALDNINRAMINTVGRYTDEALVNPDIAASGTTPASLTNGASQVASTGSTEATITANIKRSSRSP